MSQLGAKARAGLPDSSFAYIDSSGRRLLPIHDEAHVRNALARFNRVLFDDEAARDRARSRLLKAAQRHRIVPIGFVEGQLRPRLPVGQLTLLFADVEASSVLLAELEDRYGAALSAVRRIQRKAVRHAGGHEVDARADEFFAVFEGATPALSAARAMQRAMREHAWPDGRDVRVRVGLHTGRPTLTASGYQGLSVNVASRICSYGHGGQVLISRSARAALWAEPEVELRHLGSFRLRGIPDEHDIYQAVAPDLLDEFPPLRTDG